jgi:hypothetical protein
MAKRHKHAGASVTIETELGADRIAALCEDTARKVENVGVQVRLEDSKPGRLVYSVRNRLMGGRIEFMTFAVTLTESGGRHQVKTKILTYKMKRQWILIIPMPWQMQGWPIYRKFMHSLKAAVEAADGAASAQVVELEVAA